MTVMMFGIVEDFRAKNHINYRIRANIPQIQAPMPTFAKFLEIKKKFGNQNKFCSKIVANFAWNCKQKFVVAENQIRYRLLLYFYSLVHSIKLCIVLQRLICRYKNKRFKEITRETNEHNWTHQNHVAQFSLVWFILRWCLIWLNTVFRSYSDSDSFLMIIIIFLSVGVFFLRSFHSDFSGWNYKIYCFYSFLWHFSRFSFFPAPI